MSYIDLHMHSNISSDGEFTPARIMELCSKNNVTIAALADHNTIRGIPEALKTARELDITLIPAVELDCVHAGINLHVLGYGISHTEEFIDRFNKIEKDIEIQEQSASKTRIDLVKQLGIQINLDHISKLSINGVVTGEMIAEVVLNDAANDDNPLLLPFRSGQLRGDNPYVNFYWDVCSPGKPAYVPIHFISLNEAIETIHQAGGVAVLAHPGNNIGTDANVLKELIEAGIEGIEAFSSYHNESTTDFYTKKAKEHQVLLTLGSDFHGKTKPSIQLGSISCNDREDEIYQTLTDKICS